MKKFYRNTLIIITGLVLSLIISYGASEASPSNPPSNNAPTPINIAGGQFKSGGLAVGSNILPISLVKLDVNGSSGIFNTNSLFVSQNAQLAQSGGSSKVQILNNGSPFPWTSSAVLTVKGLIRSDDLSNNSQKTICADPQGMYVLCNPTPSTGGNLLGQ